MIGPKPDRLERDRLGMPLTPRQAELLDRIAQGDTYVEAAAHLGISVQTAKHQIASAYTRLGARSAAHAVALVRPEGER